MDVELQVLAELKTLQDMGCKVGAAFKDVKAHQDQLIPHKLLPRDAQLNVVLRANELAKSMTTGKFYNNPYGMMETTKIQ